MNFSNILSVKYIFLLSAIVFATTSCAGKKTSVIAQTATPPEIEKINPNQSTNTNQTPTPKKIVKTNISAPEILSRKNWKAKKAKGKGVDHKIEFITIHHTASKQKPKTSIERKLKNLQNYSQRKEKRADGSVKPAWIDIPYHYYIAPNGVIAEAREIKFAGDTNTKYNPKGHALIVLEGNFEKEKPTAEQIKSMKQITAWLANKYEVSTEDIKAHNNYAQTACPGKNLKNILPNLRESIVKNPLETSSAKSTKYQFR